MDVSPLQPTRVVTPVVFNDIGSRESAVDYMTPSWTASPDGADESLRDQAVGSGGPRARLETSVYFIAPTP